MTFAYPILAYAAIAAFAASIAISVAFERRKKRLLEKFAADSLLPELSGNVSRIKTAAKALFISLAASSLLLALARPQWGYKWEEERQMGIDIIFAVDTSKSMLAEDVKPGRLERAKLAITDAVERLDGDRVGLVAFSGQAFLQCPVTLDYGAFRMSLDALDTNIIQRGGTNIAAAIDEADSAFPDGKNEKVIVLISDGEELESSGVARAEKASKERGIKIYTLGVGGANGELIPVRDRRGNLDYLRDENGKLVTSMLNEKLLKQIAESTGGFYAPLADGGMDEIYEKGLSREQKAELSAKMKKLAIERFQIPLAAALFLLAFECVLGTRRMFRRRGAAVPAIVAAAIASAALPGQSRAEESVRQAGWRELFNAGVGAYEAGDYKQAKDSFYSAIASTHDLEKQAAGYYNIGETDYARAKAGFEKAPNPREASEKAAQAAGKASEVLSGAGAVLEKGLAALKNSGEEGLKEQGLQNEIKQAISACEESEKSVQEAAKAGADAAEAVKGAAMAADAARKNFQNARELDSEMENAEKGENAAKAACERLSEISKDLEKAGKASEEYAKALDKMVEELKKLLRDDNKNDKNQDSKDSQDRQNDENRQDSQQNQQNQDSQSQDQNGSQNQKEDAQNGDGQQNQDGSPQNDSQNSEKKDDSPEAEKDGQNGRENNPSDGPDADRQNAESQPGEDKEKPSDDSGSQSPGEEKDSGEGSQNEQAAKPEPRQQAEGDKAGGEDSQDRREEQAAPKGAEAVAEQAAAPEENAEKAGDAASESDAQDYRAEAGVMTRREAAQVLDSLQDEEKKLPFSGYGSQKNRYEEKNYKDW